MIKNWRDDWAQGDFPFLFVQAAPFFRHYPGAKVPPAIPSEPGDSVWAELRESQLLTSQRVPNTGMAVSIDLGDPKDIHPANKEPVGRGWPSSLDLVSMAKRSLTAVRRTSRWKWRSDRIAIRFDHIAAGLVTKGDGLQGFTIAGEDRKFRNCAGPDRRTDGHRLECERGTSEGRALRLGKLPHRKSLQLRRAACVTVPHRSLARAHRAINGPRCGCAATVLAWAGSCAGKGRSVYQPDPVSLHTTLVESRCHEAPHLHLACRHHPGAGIRGPHKR